MNLDVNDKNNSLKNSKEILSFHEEVFCAVEDGKNKTKKILNQETNNIQLVHTRVYLMRHLPYKDTKAYNEYNEIRKELKNGNETRLKRFGELDDMLEADETKADRELFDQIFLDPQNVVFIHNDYESSKKRIRQTIDFVKNKKNYQGYTEEEFSIVGSKKGGNKMKALLHAGHEINEILIYIKENIKKYEGKTIIILGSRSHSHFLDKEKFDEKGKNETEEEFERKGYDFIEFNEKGLHIENKDKIIITPENYMNLKGIFGNIKDLSLLDFQNKINQNFENGEWKYEEFLLHENEDLRIFCILNLIRNGKIEILNQFFQKKQIDISKISFLSKREKSILNYYTDSYNNILIIKQRSLDKRIARGEDINPHFNFENIAYKEDILNLVNSGKTIKYIEGKAGAGKSFLLSYIAEKLNNENLENNTGEKPYYPIYISLSDISIESFYKEMKYKLDKIENTNIYQVVFLIDSIDESNISIEQRDILDKKLIELSVIGKVIITSRPGYLYDYKGNNKDQKELLDKKQEVLEIKDFEEKYLEEYLSKYFNNHKNKIKLTKNILLKLKGVGNNPLLLCMICEIVNEGKVKDRGIQEITIIDIYNEIVELRILKWNETHEGRKIDLSDDDIYERLTLLSEIGFSVLFDQKTLSFQRIKTIGKLRGSEKSKKEYVESLNLLFKKNDNLEYDFVHQSFKEYFAAKYIFNQLECHYDTFNFEQFLCQDLKKVDTNFLELLCNMVQIDDKIKEKFLQKIEENENYFSPDIHHKIFYIFGILDENRENEYLNEIAINNDIIETILKYGGKKHINFIIKSLDYNKTHDYEIKDKCLIFIIKNGGREQFNFLHDYFDANTSKSGKIKFLESIGENGGEKYLDFFVEVFYTDDSIDIKLACVAYILLFGGKKYTDFFQKIFENQDISQNIKEAYLQYIIKYGGVEYKDLITENIKRIIENETSDEFLSEHNEFIINFLLLQILEHGNEDYLEFFIEFFKSKIIPEKILDTCLQYVNKYGGEKYIDFFQEIYKSKESSDELKQISLSYIIQNGGEKRGDFILEIFHTQNISDEISKMCIKYIVENCGKGGKELIKDYIIQIFHRKDNFMDFVKVRLFEDILPYLGKEYLEFIVSILNNDDNSDIISNNYDEIQRICFMFILEHGSGEYVNIIKEFIYKKSNLFHQFEHSFIPHDSQYIFKCALKYILKYGGNECKEFYVIFLNDTKDDKEDYLEILEEYGGKDNIDLYIKIFDDENASEKLRSKCLSYISKYGSYKYLDILYKQFYNGKNSEWIRNLCLQLVLEYSGKILYQSELLDLTKEKNLAIIKEIFNTEKYSGDTKSVFKDNIINYLGIDYIDLFINDFENPNNSSWLKYTYLKFIFEKGGDSYIDFAMHTFHKETDETKKKLCLEYIWSFGGVKYKDFFINQYNIESDIKEKIKYLEYILKFGGDKSIAINFAIETFNNEDNEGIKEICLNYIWVLGKDKYIDFFIETFYISQSRKIKIECVKYFFGIGGKKAIEFIKQLVREKKEEDISLVNAYLKILETIILGKENIEFANEQRKLLGI